MFVKELKNFSGQNWWVYIMLVFILGVVYYTGKGNLIEIVLLFLANFAGNLFVMIAMGNYDKQRNKIASIYHVLATSAFTSIGIYGIIFSDQYQYILWQITFIAGAIKLLSFYTFEKDLKVINEKPVAVVNILILTFFIVYFEPNIASILQGVGFSLVTTGLVSIKDSFRYFMNLLGSIFIIIGSLIVVVMSFSNGNLDGIALGFLLLTSTSVVYFLKLLPSYLIKIKK